MLRDRSYLLKDDQIAVMLQAKVKGASLVVVEDNKDGSYVATFVPSQVSEIKLSVSTGGNTFREAHSPTQQ